MEQEEWSGTQRPCYNQGARRLYFSGEDKERRTRRRRRRKHVVHCSSKNTECRGQGSTEETGMPVA